MEEDQSSILVAEEAIKNVKLSLSTQEEIVTYSINDCPVTHPSQLSNPFLGLPLEAGKCESCGASENDKCEGHFGYIELPVPIYHPCHVSELRQLLSLVCLKCLQVKKGKVKQSNGKENVSVTSCYYCRDFPALSLKEIKTTDGAIRLELRAPPQKRMKEDSWNFLDKYGFHYGGCSRFRPLLPAEVLNILKKIPDDTRKKLASRGHIVQSVYVMKNLPVPPNCLYIPEFTDGQSIMSYGPQDNTKRYAVVTDSAMLSTKQWSLAAGGGWALGLVDAATPGLVHCSLAGFSGLHPQALQVSA